MAAAAVLPPRAPSRGRVAGGRRGKRPPLLPPALDVDLDAGCDEGPQKFSVATPVRAAGGVRRHYMGTPTAGGILSAFMDLDGWCESPREAYPPLDFDRAMAALDPRGCWQDAAGPPLDFDEAMTLLEQRSRQALAAAEGEAPGPAGDAVASDGSASDRGGEGEEDTECEEYESDFESESECSDDGPECADLAAGGASPGEHGLLQARRRRSRSAASRRGGGRSASCRREGAQQPGAAGRSRGDSRPRPPRPPVPLPPRALARPDG